MEHGDYLEKLDEHLEHSEGYDTSEPKGGFIAVFAIATIITLVATMLGIQYYFDQAHEKEVYTEVLAPESNQLRDLHAKEDTELYSYQYVDRAQGTVRLTIDRAMELLAKEAAENRVAYPTKPYAVLTPEQLAAGPAPQGATKNATPPPPAK